MRDAIGSTVREAVRRWWEEKAPRRTGAPIRAESGTGRNSDLGSGGRWRRTIPPDGDLRLYDEMRRSFPILDVAVTRLVQLCGHPRVEGESETAAEVERWMGTVASGPAQRGLGRWLETHLDHMLVFGKGVGRIYLTPLRREVAGVVAYDPRGLRLEEGTDPLSLRVMRVVPGNPNGEELPRALTLLSLHAPQGNPHGSSLLRSLPFVTEACSIIENATAQVWQRAGAPSFHVNWQAGAEFCDPQGTVADQVTRDLTAAFESVMAARKYGEIRDLFTTGNVGIGSIGQDTVNVALQEPFRVFVEQMVAVTGLPPWMLGLHWSSTERLSAQQADMLVANIEGIRREVQPQLDQLLELRQSLTGRSSRVRFVWPAISLRDATEQARAAAWSEQARQRRIENARTMWALGFWTQDQAAREADPTLAGPARRLSEVPRPSGTLPGRLTPAVDE
jgi:hypothetical protein